MDQFVAEWNTWRDSRNSSLARSFGWLSVTGLHWLDEESSWPGAPGTFTVEDGWVRVALQPGTNAGPAAATFDLLGKAAEAAAGDPETSGQDGSGDDQSASASAVQVRIEDGGFGAKLPSGGSLDWFTVGHVLYELIERGGRLGVRIRDSKSPLLQKFIEVPVFEPDHSFVYLAKFTPFDPPETRTIRTAQPDLTLSTAAAGTVTFNSSFGEIELIATGCPVTGLQLDFHDETNGHTTSAWRTVELGVPGQDGSLVVDFNRAVNYPFAFTAFATCPAPVDGNVVPFPVRAGEQRPPFYLSESGINTPFLFYKWWDKDSADISAVWYPSFGLDTTILNPLEDNDDPSLVGFDGLAMSGGDLSLLSRRSRSRLIKVATEALTSRIPVIGIGGYAELVIRAQRELRAQLGYDDGIEEEYSVTDGHVLFVANNELDPLAVGLNVVFTDDSGLVYVEAPTSLDLESSFTSESEFAEALAARSDVRSWQEFAYRVAQLILHHR